jgi:hypothetical protein
MRGGTWIGVLLLTVGALQLWPAVASANEWSTTFESETVAMKLEAPDERFVVVPAGEGNLEETQAATEALIAALREGEAEVVMDDQSLGDVAALDDDAIVEEAASLPVDRVIVVRVFPGGDGPPRAVVTMYAAATSESVSGFTARRGTPVTTDDRQADAEEPDEDDREESASAGVSKQTSETVTETTDEIAENQKQARQEFLEKFLWFRSEVEVEATGSTATATEKQRPVRGKYAENIKPVDFYRTAGRDKLADKYDERSKSQKNS